MNGPDDLAGTTPGEEEKVRQVIEVSLMKGLSWTRLSRVPIFLGVREPVRHAVGTDDVGTGPAEHLFDEQGILQHGIFAVYVLGAFDYRFHVRWHLLQVISSKTTSFINDRLLF